MSGWLKCKLCELLCGHPLMIPIQKETPFEIREASYKHADAAMEVQSGAKRIMREATAIVAIAEALKGNLK